MPLLAASSSDSASACAGAEAEPLSGVLGKGDVSPVNSLCSKCSRKVSTPQALQFRAVALLPLDVGPQIASVPFTYSPLKNGKEPNDLAVYVRGSFSSQKA